jgi:hypothetical protein
MDALSHAPAILIALGYFLRGLADFVRAIKGHKQPRRRR